MLKHMGQVTEMSTVTLKKPISGSRKTRIRKVCVVRLYGLGNLILALPLIDAVRKSWPKAECVLYLDARCEAIARYARPGLRVKVHESIEDASEWFAAEKPDATLFTFPTGLFDLVAAARRHSGLSVCHDVARNMGGAHVNLTADPQRLEAELNLDLLRACGVSPRMARPSISVGRTEAGRVRAMLASEGIRKPYVALHPGCHGDWPQKRWAPKRFGALVDLLADDGLDAVVLGGADETEVADAVVAAVGRGRVSNLCGCTSLPETAAILKGAEVVVSNDSGLMHLAAAVGAPVAALFGPTSWYKNPPLARRFAVVRRPVACSPCFVAGGGRPRRAWCMEMIEPGMAREAVRCLREGRNYVPQGFDQPFVSVIVPTRNRGKNLNAMMDALLAQTYPRDRYEVIVIDNDSTDDTADTIRAKPGIRYEFTNLRHSSYTARNHGIAVAKGTILAFTDDDAIAAPDWIEKGVEWFEHPGIGCVAGETLTFDPRGDVAHYQARKRHMAPSPDIEFAMGHAVATVNCFYRREVFDLLGVFDAQLISGGDLDMTFRVRRDGRWGIRHAADAVVLHRNRETVKDLARVFFRYGYGSPVAFKRYNRLPLDARLRQLRDTWKRAAKEGWRLAQTGIRPTRLNAEVVGLDRWLETRAAGASIYCLASPSTASAIRRFRGLGVRVHPVPVFPPAQYLNEALRAVAETQPGGLFLYAAGQHSRRVVQLPNYEELGVRGFIDDKAAPGQRLGERPVVTLAQAREMGLKTILISTDYYEAELLRKLAPLRDEGLAVLGFYNPDAYERFGRYWAGRVGDHRPEALWMPEWVLEPGCAQALARGLGVGTLLMEGRPPERYSDEFLDWVTLAATIAGRAVGSVRYGYFAP